MKENKKIIVIIIIVLLSIFSYLCFYRPYKIRKSCNEESFMINNNGMINSSIWLDMQEKLYKDCIRFNGLKN